MTDYKKQGKKNRASGAAFERKVRADLEKKGWIVCKWQNQVEELEDGSGYHLVPARHQFNPFTKAMTVGHGFPDFIAYKQTEFFRILEGNIHQQTYDIIGVECKSNGQLKQIEQDKCGWLVINQIFSKVLVASKGTKRGTIDYNEVTG